jgi:hypothetical protein
MPDDMTPRARAILLGETTYFTGKPCSKGHRRSRDTATAQCLACADDYHDRFKFLEFDEDDEEIRMEELIRGNESFAFDLRNGHLHDAST